MAMATGGTTRRAARGGALAVCLAAGIVQVAAAQQPKFLPRTREDVDRAVRWTEAVLRHQPGLRDAAVDDIARWDARALSDIPIEVSVIRILIRNPDERLFHAPDDGRSVPPELGYAKAERDRLRNAAENASRGGLDDTDLIARGVLLHTDVALLAEGGGPVLRYADGRPLAVEHPADHWALARQFAAWLDRRSGRQPDVRLWYRATLAAMATVNRWDVRHADAAAAQRPVDAELLFQAACVHEMVAADRVQSSLPDAKVPYDVAIRVRTAGEELRLAGSLLKRAIELDSSHVDARIHYGRVLTLIERPADAIVELHRADRDANTRDQQYYARLFLGGAFDELIRNDEARAAYEGAAGLFPDAPSPQFGLSHAAMRQGDH